MSTVQDLSEYLDRDFSPDYWADEAIDHAYDLIKQLTPPDWGMLRSMWSTMPKRSQHRLAQVIYQAPVNEAHGLIQDMLHSPDDDLVQEVVDTLNAMEDVPVHVWLDQKTIKRLEALALSRGPLDAKIIRELLSRKKS